MTESMIERVAAAILVKVPNGYGMTAGEARTYARAAITEVAEWLGTQRHDVPAHGWEFAAALKEPGGGQ